MQSLCKLHSKNLLSSSIFVTDQAMSTEFVSFKWWKRVPQDHQKAPQMQMPCQIVTQLCSLNTACMYSPYVTQENRAREENWLALFRLAQHQHSHHCAGLCQTAFLTAEKNYLFDQMSMQELWLLRRSAHVQGLILRNRKTGGCKQLRHASHNQKMHAHFCLNEAPHKHIISHEGRKFQARKIKGAWLKRAPRNTV